MKILMLTPYVPYPPNSGGQIRTFNLIKNLSEKHDITLFSFIRSDQKPPDLGELKKYARKIRFFTRKRSFGSVGKIIKTGFSLYPYLVNMYLSSELKQAVAYELGLGSYDLIHVETYYIMPNLPKTSIPILLAEQTIEYLVYQHYAKTSSWRSIWPVWSAKPLLYIDVAKHKFWEEYFWLKAKKVVAMSKSDKEKMLEIVPRVDVDVVPNGVDIQFFSKEVTKRVKNMVLFVGNFNWLQNREAVDVLVDKVWPKIKEVIPSAILWIVGRDPTLRIKNMIRKDVEVSSNLDDIRYAFQKASVLVAPLYGEGGTRYKILEAMMSGLPVVTTSIGIEGIGADGGEHALLADSYDDLAKATVKVMKDLKLADNLARKAKLLVAKNFGWESISKKLDKIYEETAKKN